MAVRMEVELTSTRDDGTWTWRAAGARQPKGVLDAALVPTGSSVGDVVRVEAEMELDGVTVTSVLPPKTPRREPERLQLIATAGNDGPLVTSNVTAKGDRGDRDRGERGDRDDRGRGERGRGDRGSRATAPKGEGRGGPGRDNERGRGRDDRPGARGHERSGARGPARRPGSSGAPSDRPRPTGSGPRPEAPTASPKPKRLSPGRKHRDAVLAALAPEEAAVAEQLLRGGISGVRNAVEEQNTKARAEGLPEVKGGALLTMAEGLLPRLRAAEWHDRADAARAAVDEIGLRDLRAVVTGADAGARDDDTRALASELRQALERRTATGREAWVAQIAEALDDGRVVRALRMSGRGPEPGTRMPIELGNRLRDAASAALGPDTTNDRWLALLDAVTASPVRTSVRPAGLPSDADEALKQAAQQAVARVPGVGVFFGAMPLPQPPRRPPPPAAVEG